MRFLKAVSSIVSIANPIAGVVVNMIGDIISGPKDSIPELEILACNLEKMSEHIRVAIADGDVTEAEAEALAKELKRLEL